LRLKFQTLIITNCTTIIQITVVGANKSLVSMLTWKNKIFRKLNSRFGGNFQFPVFKSV
jgi:hypothetical protein